jgi:hypothetical protein
VGVAFTKKKGLHRLGKYSRKAEANWRKDDKAVKGAVSWEAWIVGLVAGRSMWCASRFAFELVADVILGGLDGVQMRHQDWNPANERLVP